MDGLGDSEVRTELDRTLLELMGSLKRLSGLRNKYSDLAKEGFFAVSQARHAMGGPLSVCSLQYDSAMKSLVNIELQTNLTLSEETEIPSLYSDMATLVPPGEKFSAEFHVERMKPGEVYRDCVRSEEDESDDKLRQRKVRSLEGVEDVPRGENREVVKELKDPLKWFGILVPQSLRQAQQHFIQVIKISAELAAVQMEVEVLRERYQQLLTKKKTLTVGNSSAQ